MLATSGEAGIDGLDPAACGPLREAEEQAGAALVGVDSVQFLGHPDGVLEYGIPLRRDVARAVRIHRPDIVITVNYHDSWGPGRPNQADHIALGRAVLDGTRDAANRWVFRDLDIEPHKVSTLLVCGVPAASHGVDVTEHFECGIASLQAHAQYLRGLNDTGMADPRELLETLARQNGAELGVRYAVGFDVIAL